MCAQAAARKPANAYPLPESRTTAIAIRKVRAEKKANATRSRRERLWAKPSSGRQAALSGLSGAHVAPPKSAMRVAVVGRESVLHAFTFPLIRADDKPLSLGSGNVLLDTCQPLNGGVDSPALSLLSSISCRPEGWMALMAAAISRSTTGGKRAPRKPCVGADPNLSHRADPILSRHRVLRASVAMQLACFFSQNSDTSTRWLFWRGLPCPVSLRRPGSPDCFQVTGRVGQKTRCDP